MKETQSYRIIRHANWVTEIHAWCDCLNERKTCATCNTLGKIIFLFNIFYLVAIPPNSIRIYWSKEMLRTFKLYFTRDFFFKDEWMNEPNSMKITLLIMFHRFIRAIYKNKFWAIDRRRWTLFCSFKNSIKTSAVKSKLEPYYSFEK